MDFIKKLFFGKRQPTQRIRVCRQCGMPVGEHKDWCSVYRMEQTSEQRNGVAAAK
jgi:hypothetical protein